MSIHNDQFSTNQDPQYKLWNSAYAGDEYYYGSEPGPLARRAVRYHHPNYPQGGTALDVGCGEGQDLAFLAECGYTATGIEFTAHGVIKTRRFLAERSLQAEVVTADIRTYSFNQQFDLVLVVNTIQFLGDAASACLDRVIHAVATGGVIGLSIFAREADQPSMQSSVFFMTLPELMERFPPDHWQMLEASQLWQWSPRTVHKTFGKPQAFVTLIAQRIA